MKPTSKSESRWLLFRNEHRSLGRYGSPSYEKKQLRRAKRRFLKSECSVGDVDVNEILAEKRLDDSEAPNK